MVPCGNQSIWILLSRYLSIYPTEESRLRLLIDDMPEYSNGCDRKRMPGHLTASGIVRVEQNMLMVFHPALSKWLQPGGHVESGESLLDGAKRETFEETGLRCDSRRGGELVLPIDIDVHRIPANPQRSEPEHLHYDFRYLLLPLSTCDLQNGEHRSKWIPIRDISEPNLQHLLEKIDLESQ